MLKGLSQTSRNDTIRVVAAPNCGQCGDAGETLYRGLGDRLFGAPGRWDLNECVRCKLIWLNPRPASEDIGKLYGDAYLTHSTGGTPGRLASLRRLLRNAVLAGGLGYEVVAPTGVLSRLMGRALGRIGPIRELVAASVMWLEPSGGGRLLDVGAGNGWFVARMRDLGWDAQGVEPDPAAVRVAGEELGVEIKCSTLEASAYPDESVDVITLAHVIEHLPDPISTLKECRRILRLGGRVVITTPNTRSLGRRLFREDWLHWSIPQHMTLFCPSALENFVVQAGLVPVRVATVCSGAIPTWQASRLLQRHPIITSGMVGRTYWRARPAGVGFLLVEYLASRFFPAGEEIHLVAEKQE